MLKTILEICQWTLYDSQPLSKIGDLNDLHFFSEPWGSIDEAKKTGSWRCTFLRTNMIEAGRLPHPTKFLVDRLNVLFFRNDKPLQLRDTELYARTEIRFDIAQKVYWQSPAWRCASALALFDTPKDEIPKLKEKYGIEWDQIGASLHSNAGMREIPVTGLLIENAMQFSVHAHIHGATTEDLAETSLSVHLDGPYLRPVV